MFAKTKDILAIIQDVEDKTVDNRVNLECLERDFQENKRFALKAFEEVSNNFDQIEEKHNGFVNKVAESIEELSDKVAALQRQVENLDKWDDNTRGKFYALENHFGFDFILPNKMWTIEEREEINYSTQDSN